MMSTARTLPSGEGGWQSGWHYWIPMERTFKDLLQEVGMARLLEISKRVLHWLENVYGQPNSSLAKELREAIAEAEEEISLLSLDVPDELFLKKEHTITLPEDEAFLNQIGQQEAKEPY